LIQRSARRPERGFTLIEVMIALMILLLGIAGLLSMQLQALRATSFSRHASEASALCEDKMEELRTIPSATLTNGSDQVDSRAVDDSQGLYTRTWTIDTSTGNTILTVQTAWNEQGATTPETMTMSTIRSTE
jgi:type IV pilus assembly protein PilV